MSFIELKSNHELDALVAIRVMNWRRGTFVGFSGLNECQN